jgi:hypothetical protein
MSFPLGSHTLEKGSFQPKSSLYMLLRNYVVSVTHKIFPPVVVYEFKCEMVFFKLGF